MMNRRAYRDELDMERGRWWFLGTDEDPFTSEAAWRLDNAGWLFLGLLDELRHALKRPTLTGFTYYLRVVEPPPWVVWPRRATSDSLTALALLSSVLAVVVVVGAASTPLVYRAWPGGDCRAVVTAAGAPGDCASVPPVHHTVWVSPHWKVSR